MDADLTINETLQQVRLEECAVTRTCGSCWILGPARPKAKRIREVVLTEAGGLLSANGPASLELFASRTFQRMRC
jgi:hypothetical protein